MIPPSGPDALLRILATSDVHMHLKSHDYFANAPLRGRSLEALAGQIAQLRAEAEADGGQVLLFDNGDLLQGTPLADHLVAELDEDAVHPVALVLSDLGYDAVGVGNHDVDYGLAYLERFARDLPCPVISSNMHLTDPSDWLAPSALLDCGPWKVGVLSVLPQRTMVWSHTQLSDRAVIDDMTATCCATAKDLRARGANVVVALAHTGIGHSPEENALLQIAASGAVDALVGGHTHALFPSPGPVAEVAINPERGTLHNVPTVMPGFAAEAVGCIDLNLNREADGTVRVADGTARLVCADISAKHDVPALKQITPEHERVCAKLDEVIGTTDAPLTSYMAQVQPTRLLEMTAAAKIELITQAAAQSPFSALPVLAAVSPSRAGGTAGPQNYADIPPGPLRRRQIAEMHVFPNAIWAVPITGADLTAWLEKAAAAFARPEERAEVGLLSPTVPSYDFDMIFGVTYDINPLAPPRYDRNGTLLDPNTRRIENLRYQGQSVQDTDRFLVATNSYRACGGGHFPILRPNRDMLRTNIPSSRVMQNYVASGATLDLPHPWRFSKAAKGTRTWFETGPGALAHLSDIADLAPSSSEETETGFVRIEITL